MKMVARIGCWGEGFLFGEGGGFLVYGLGGWVGGGVGGVAWVVWCGG